MSGVPLSYMPRSSLSLAQVHLCHISTSSVLAAMPPKSFPPFAFPETPAARQQYEEGRDRRRLEVYKSIINQREWTDMRKCISIAERTDNFDAMDSAMTKVYNFLAREDTLTDDEKHECRELAIEWMVLSVSERFTEW